TSAHRPALPAGPGRRSAGRPGCAQDHRRHRLHPGLGSRLRAAAPASAGPPACRPPRPPYIAAHFLPAVTSAPRILAYSGDSCPFHGGRAMKLKTLALILALSGTGLAAGCSSPSIVTRDDGRQVVTSDEPEYDEDSGFYEYEKDGRTTRVNKDRVEKI